MGSRGPVPSPIKVLDLKNNSHRSTKPRKPLGESRRLSPPKWLSAGAKKIWKRLEPLVRQSKLMTQADRDSFGRLCEAQCLYERAVVECQQETTLVTDTPNGNTKISPALKAVMDCSTLLQRLSADFGLTPPGRARLHVQPEEHDQTDGVHEFLFGSSDQSKKSG